MNINILNIFKLIFFHKNLVNVILLHLQNNFNTQNISYFFRYNGVYGTKAI